MEQDTVKIVKRTVGLLLILVLAAGIAGVLLWRFGSPWGASGAQKDIQDYVEQTYSGRNLKVGRVSYNLATRGYQAWVESETREDVFFTVSAKDGEILSDSYEADVEQKGNTVRRLEETYTELVRKQLEEEALSVPAQASVHLDSASVGAVRLGMAFSMGNALQYNLMLEGTADDPSPEAAARLLEEVYARMDAAGYGFSFYGVQLENDGASVTAAQVTPAQIKGGNLARIFQLALEGDTESGVYLVTRGPEKAQEESAGE